jgi:hypothetical protein
MEISDLTANWELRKVTLKTRENEKKQKTKLRHGLNNSDNHMHAQRPSTAKYMGCDIRSKKTLAH